MAEDGPTLRHPPRAEPQPLVTPGSLRRSTFVRSPDRATLTFVGLTLLALMVDLLMVVPPVEEQDGHHWEVFGRWDTTLTQTVVLMTLAYAPLLLRMRHPLPVLTWISLLGFVLAFSHDWAQPILGPMVALYTAAAVLPRLHAYHALGVGLVALLAATWVKQEQWGSTSLALVIVGMIATIVWLLGRREHASSARVGELRDELLSRHSEAAEEERRRIARELHDILAHSVSAMMMQAAGARAITHRLVGPESDARLETVERALATIETTGAQSMRELHRLLGTLREEVPTSRAPGSGPAPVGEPATTATDLDVTHLVTLTRQSGLTVQVHVSGTPVELDPSVQIAAYRLAQESFTNAMKHGGRGAVVDLYLTWGAERLQLQVRSRRGHDAAGPPGTVDTRPPSGGAGLTGLRERVELVGGTFDAGWVDHEFVTTAVLPLTPVPSRQEAVR
ncbi:sensor histidine kinase [Ornithinimicrobium sp. LYQ121]|uniref:sensor histidine kinase n=1 Tax=Ornithinimicrobium sp. LYQ121 TaxID=3378801 RepID=UPI0038518D2B